MTDLADFIQQHATPYDPAADSYRRPPFALPVKAGKNSPIYNAHSYHTKVPPEGIVPYIEHYTNPGDLILDPFCGSGMTGVAALMTGRHAILNDLSPAAVHIARNYTTPVDVDALTQEFERIKAAVKEEFDWLYGTTCDRCGGQATIQYTIWSDVFECRRCSHEIILWDTAVDPISGNVSSEFECKVCRSLWQKSQLKRVGVQPVVTNYICSECKPGRYERLVTQSEKQLVRDIEISEIPYWFPTTKMDKKAEMYIRSALGLRNIETIDDLWTRRNLRAFAAFWDTISKIADKTLRLRLQFVMTASVPSLTAMTLYTPNRAGRSYRKGTLYIPSLSIEQNVFEVVNRRFDRVIKCLEQIPAGDIVVDKHHAGNLQDIPNSTIDYVFTDPPFGSNIFYSDLNLLWESWLQDFTDANHEAVINRSKKNGKDLADYSVLMNESFREIKRVLKPGRWASVVFHNSDDKVWQIILNAVETAGLELAEINAFDKKQLSFKGIKGAKGEERVTNQDIVLNLRKPRPVELAQANGRTNAVEVEQRIMEHVADFLVTNPPSSQRTLQYLWNHVLYDMLREGSVEASMAQVEEMLAFHYQTFKLVDGRYYLRGEAVVGGNVFDLVSDAGAIAWLNAVLSREPQTTGDLIPKWQQETANPSTSLRTGASSADPGRLDRLLEQNFWQDQRTGRWRLPTPAEREKMSARVDLSAQAHLRVVRRYLAGELDRRPGQLELAAWLRFCYSREFFSEAAQLFPHLDETQLEAEDYRAIKRMATVSKMRAGQ